MIETDIHRRTPWWFWLVGALALLWNGFGAADYVMTQLRDPGYLAQFPAEMMAMLDAMPAWATAAWAIGVWASLLGAMLLLLRSRFAVPAYALSLAGLAVSSVYQATTPMPDALNTVDMRVMYVVIWSALVFLLIFSVSMRRKRRLR